MADCAVAKCTRLPLSPLSVCPIMEKVNHIFRNVKTKASVHSFCFILKVNQAPSLAGSAFLLQSVAVQRYLGSHLEPVGERVLEVISHEASKATWLWKKDTRVHGERERKSFFILLGLY